MHRALRIAVIAVAVLAVLLLVAGWLGDRWLESAGGRRLLERQLSAAIGNPVRLRGDYHFRFVPRIVISGRDLAIGTPVNDPPVTVASFRTAVGLVPLLRGALRVDAIVLGGGRVDVARAAQLGGASGAADEPASLPAVAKLELDDFTLVLPGDAGPVRLGRLRLAGFHAGRQTPLELQAERAGGEGTAIAVGLQGQLEVAADGSYWGLTLQPLTFRRGRSQQLELRGTLGWQVRDHRLTADLDGEMAASRLSATLDAQLLDTLAGRATLRYEPGGDYGEARLAVAFVRRDDAVVLQPVAASLDEVALSGSGCLLSGEPPLLALSLSGDEVDLDRLRKWLPDSSGGAQPELPVDVAVEIRLGAARLAGATAEGVRVLVGSAPHCPGSGSDPQPQSEPVGGPGRSGYNGQPGPREAGSGTEG